MVADIADGMERCTTDFPSSFGNHIGHCEYLRCLFIEEQVVIAKVGTSDVPVEVFRLEIEREYIGQQLTKIARNLRDRFIAEIGWCVETIYCPSLQLSCIALCHHSSLLCLLGLDRF